MIRLRHLIDDLNMGTFNPVGLNILWPRNLAFLYVSSLRSCSNSTLTTAQLEIEYYVSLAFQLLALTNLIY